MARAWRKAARDLAIRFDSPFAIEHRGRLSWCAGFLPDFGSPLGTVIAGRETLDEVFDAADEVGYYASGLSPHYYERYERDLFIETLNDWGWFADPANAPSWFEGGFGRHGGNT
jgi:hypothetical protein